MTEKVEREANDTVISEILEMNPELEGIGNYEYGWADSDVAGQGEPRGGAGGAGAGGVGRQGAASTRPLCAIFP